MMRPFGLGLTLVAMFFLLRTNRAQDVRPATEAPGSPPTVTGGDVTPDTLRDDQLAVSGRYARFERMLTQMADILGQQDPERADLLRRAIGKGREGRIREQIENVVALIESGEIGNASEKQADVIESLQELLKLLQSEDRRSAVERERNRLNALLKDVRGVLAEQRSARAATQNSPAPSSAAPGQQKAISETDKLLESMRAHDDQESKDGVPKDDEPGKGDPKQSDKPSKGSSENGKQKSDKNKQTPGREQLEKAREEMERAIKELKEQNREEALKNEDHAIEELHEAGEKLEAMLRQLREEEKEMMLASLEARFQRMLQAETAIHEGTVGVAATPQDDWLDLNYGRCRELSQQQSELTQECAQTVNLLREEGTSVAIVIAVEDIEADMNSVSEWMQEYKVGELTQSVQKDILESLKQLIETTQKEMQEMKDQQKQEQQQRDPSEEKPGLVELMAEIRVLRSLQLQVNRRTKQVDGLLQSSTTDDLPALQKQLHDLAIRQNRLIESAKELAKQAK